MEIFTEGYYIALRNFWMNDTLIKAGEKLCVPIVTEARELVNAGRLKPANAKTRERIEAMPTLHALRTTPVDTRRQGIVRRIPIFGG